MQQPDYATGIIWYGVFLYSTVCHEAAHAWAAYRLGDDTAHRGGQVTLDPTPHMQREPVGMILMPIVSFFTNGWPFGWATAPVDPAWARQNPQRYAWVAVAGPAANALIALIAAVLMIAGVYAGVFQKAWVYRFGDPVITSASGPIWSGIATLLGVVFSMNMLGAIFNLVPVPPFDGSRLPLWFLRGQSCEAYQNLIWQPGMQLMGVVMIFNGFQWVFAPVFRQALYLLYSLM